jgi:hypothetical protein
MEKHDEREADIPPQMWRDRSWEGVAENVARGTFWITVIGAIAYIAVVIVWIFL